MKAKNLEIGLRVQVKSKNFVGFCSWHAGKFGTIVDIDKDSRLDVRVEFDDGDDGWGNHEGIKRVKLTLQDVKVGDRVRLLKDAVLGFLAGDVGIVKLVSPSGIVAVHFDEARDGWVDADLGIPDLHGLYVDLDLLEFITD